MGREIPGAGSPYAQLSRTSNYGQSPISTGDHLSERLRQFSTMAGPTLEEFALWIQLRDAYWAQEGHASLDAVVVAGPIGGLILIGVAPFDLPHKASSLTASIAAVVTVVVLAPLAILKGKRFVGLIGIFLPFVSLVGADGRLGSESDTL
jgi:hypothetical protein